MPTLSCFGFHLQGLDLGSVPATSQNPPHLHAPTDSSGGPTSALGAKPKVGVSHDLCITSSYIHISNTSTHDRIVNVGPVQYHTFGSLICIKIY